MFNNDKLISYIGDFVEGYKLRAWTGREQGPALWLISGIHGEERAGPQALAMGLPFILELLEKIPIVIIPIMNQYGFANYKRFINEKSIWDFDQTKSFVEWISRDYPPLYSIDFHEDDEREKGYLYSDGPDGIKDQFAYDILWIMISSGIPIDFGGITPRGEQLRGAIASSGEDGSIEMFMKKKGAKSIITVETPILNTNLERRIACDMRILSELKYLLKRSKNER
jgi:hypothetical protein